MATSRAQRFGVPWREVMIAGIAAALIWACAGWTAVGAGQDESDKASKSAKTDKSVKAASGKGSAKSNAKAKKDADADTEGDAESDSAAKSSKRPRKGESALPESPLETVKAINETWEQALRDAKVKPSAMATDEEFLRRAYLDFLGRVPRVEEAKAFLLSKEPDKRFKLVETLLNHPDFANNFATIWRILLIGRGNRDQNVNVPALETWLRKQFADNVPWNDVTTALIASTGSNKDNGAVNYALAHMDNDAINLTSNTTRLFLGQQIQCTQCHDHPSNDWKQQDFWGINAFFKALALERHETVNATGARVVDYVELTDRSLENDGDRYASFDRRDGQVRAVGPKFLNGAKLDPSVDVDRRKELAKLIANPENMDFSKAFVNRVWAHFMGRGFVHPVDDFGDHNTASNPELLEQIAAEFMANKFNVKDLMRWVASSKPYQLSSKMMHGNENDELLASHMTVKPMTPEQLYESLFAATNADKVGGGDFNNARDRFSDQFVSAFANDDGEQSLNFQGTIPQALMMMNGDLIARATSSQPGSFLRKQLDDAKLQRGGDPYGYVINQLYLAALSRLPTPAERNGATRLMRSDPRPDQVAADLFWALLNSNEFILNH